MHLESLMTGDANIKNLTLRDPEHRERLPFDVARDVTPEDWEAVHDQDRGSWIRQACIWSGMSWLGRPPSLSPGVIRDIRDYLHLKARSGSEDDFGKFRDMLGDIGLYAPISLDDDIWPIIRKWQNEYRRGQGWIGFTMLAFGIALHGYDPEVTPEDWQHIEDDVRSAQLSRWTAKFARMSFWTRILGRTPEIRPKDWEDMRYVLALDRQRKNWSAFAGLAGAMNALIAEEVKMTPHGLIMRMPLGKLTTEKPEPQSAIRKFIDRLPS